MDDAEFRPGECQEMAGFLFSHRCGDVAVRECADCQKPICQRHSIDSGGAMRCVACEKKLRGQQQSATNPAGGGRPYDHDPPFFYGHYYGYGYGYGYGRHQHWQSSNSQHHFVDSDEAALSGGEITAEEVSGFEDDMGAS